VYGYRWERWSALAGVLFVALFAVALALSGNTGDNPSEVQQWYADDGNQTKQIVAWFLYVGSALAFLSFLGTLRDMLVRAEGGPGTLSALVFGPGLVFAALYVAGVSLFAAPASLADDSDFKLDPNSAQLFNNAGYFLLVGGVMVASILVLSTSTAALRTGILPAWLGWAGLIVAVAMIFAIFFLPILVFAAWVLVVSLVMLIAAWRVRGGAVPPPPPAATTTTAEG
jgi:magnesium-transporting ATPase (P-type)